MMSNVGFRMVQFLLYGLLNLAHLFSIVVYDCNRNIINYPEGVCMSSLVLRLDARLAKWIAVHNGIS